MLIDPKNLIDPNRLCCQNPTFRSLKDLERRGVGHDGRFGTTALHTGRCGGCRPLPGLEATTRPGGQTLVTEILTEMVNHHEEPTMYTV